VAETGARLDAIALKRIAMAGSIACVLLVMAASFANAQGFPNKPLRIVTGFAPGGSADISARIMAQKMSEGFGQPVVVENRTGAGAMIAHEFVAKAPPDGYTLLLMAGGFPVQPALMKKLPYDALRDFAMISMITRYPFVLIVNADSPYKTPEDFVRYVKGASSKLSYGSSGIGSVHHLASELFNALAGTDIAHIPFRGGAAQMTELMGGRLDMLFEALPNAMPSIKGGKFRALAVTSAAPSPFLPDVPTMARALPGYEVSSFFALATAGGTPAAIVAQLNTEARRVLALPDVQQKFLDLGGEARASSPEEMRQFIESEIAKWTQVVEKRKIERM
jgi:tripartite-type tricarboxylate transporter receptor subunit TctC